MSIHAPEAKPISLRTPEDIVGIVPHVLGFEPSESIVMLTFGATRTFHARVDLPFDRAGQEQVIASLTDPVVRYEVQRVVLLTYSSGEEVAHARTVLEALAAAMPCEVVGAFCVTERHLFPLTEDGLLDARPRPGVTDGALEAMTNLGTAPRASRDELVASIQPDTQTDDIVALLLTDVARYDERILGICRENARSQVEYWSTTARRTSAGRGNRVCSILALAAWLSGDGALAWAAVDRARADGGTTLAEIVATMLEQAISPEQWESFAGQAGL